MRTLQTSLFYTVLLLHACKCQNNYTIFPDTPNGWIWNSTSDFIPQPAQSYGTIKIGQIMTVEFDFVFNGRSNTPTDYYEENFFRIGHKAADGCSVGSRYPSMWLKAMTAIDDTSLILDISVTSGADCDDSHFISDYGDLPIGISMHMKITLNYNDITLDITGGGKPDHTEPFTREDIPLTFLGEEVPVWWMSDKASGSSGYNVGDGTFSNIRIVSQIFTWAPTDAPTEPSTVPTIAPSTSPTEPSSHPSISPTALTPNPSSSPTGTVPTKHPTLIPSTSPIPPTINPSSHPSSSPVTTTTAPTVAPITAQPTTHPITQPPTETPITAQPTTHPITDAPTTTQPSSNPTTSHPSINPTQYPTISPTYNDGEVQEESTTQVINDINDVNDNTSQDTLNMGATTTVIIIALCVVACCILIGGIILYKKKQTVHDDDTQKHNDTQVHAVKEYMVNIQPRDVHEGTEEKETHDSPYTPEGVVKQRYADPQHEEYLSPAQKEDYHNTPQAPRLPRLPRTDDSEEWDEDKQHEPELQMSDVRQPQTNYLSDAQREELQKHGMGTPGNIEDDIVDQDAGNIGDGDGDGDFLSPAQREEVAKLKIYKTPGDIDANEEYSVHDSDDDVVGHMTPGLDDTDSPIGFEFRAQPPAVNIDQVDALSEDLDSNMSPPIENKMTIGAEDDAIGDDEEYDMQYDDEEEDEYEQVQEDQHYDDFETIQ